MKIATLMFTGIAAGAAAWYLMNTENGRRVSDQMVGTIKDKASDTIDQLKGRLGNSSTNNANSY
ncbi:MAG TPA: hypothetical protein VNI52_03770 [Sphingobacteriaceae bacterium]|nr:hypothetical protein [Sphingobacteriaceae bacterium]